MTRKRIVFCGICGEKLGEYKPKFAKNHLRKYPNHDRFIVMKIIDPLLFIHPDDWFKKKGIFPDRLFISDGFSHRELSDGDSTEPFPAPNFWQIGNHSTILL